MTKLVELDLEFDFTGAIEAIAFDNDDFHAGSTIQRVDFIAEYDECYRFIEIKDPDIPTATNRDGFRCKLQSGKLIQGLAGKYRDSLFFRTVQNKKDKRIEYIVLISMADLDDGLLLAKQDELHRAIPIEHDLWNEKSASICLVLNIRQWKRKFGDDSIRRLSDGEE